MNIALIGNPNCGKSTLFNALTGLHQKTGNYPGVTVDKKTGVCKVQNPISKQTQQFNLIDLPGTYSLFPKSLDEQVSFSVLLNEKGNEYPDIILIIVDASNLKRHLLLATQLIDLGRPCILALNMIDAAQANGISTDEDKLAQALQVPVVSCNARQGEGISKVKETFFVFEKETKPHTELVTIKALVNNDYAQSVHRYIGQSSVYASLLKHRNALEKDEHLSIYNKKFFTGFESRDLLFRFEKIKKILLDCVQYSSVRKDLKTTDRLDRLITHPFWGFIIFLAVLFIMFQSIFYLAEFPMQWIETAFSFITEKVKQTLPDTFLSNLLTNGIMAGLSGIVVFVPQIALLFGFISLLEDSGYMARVSFIMDKLMRKVGLNGRSVIPLISGMACAVPAIMSTRTISNKKERLVTILITPLMSCSARLPVYTLLIGIMLPSSMRIGFFDAKGLVLTLLYLMGIAMAVLVAFVLKYILKAKERSYFMMELPVYRVPQAKTVLLTMFEKVKVFLIDAGKIIMIISIILWFLTSYGPKKEMAAIEKKYELALAQAPSDSAKQEVRTALQTQKLQASYAGHLGKMIEPAIKPLGFDWKIGISLITSIAAREVFVGTMATLYQSKDKEDNLSIRQKMMREKNPETGELVYNFAVCLSLLMFYAFAMQCMSTLAVVKRETNTYKWALVQFIYMSALAYLASLLVYQLLR
ncbi:MAG: ferrous iron transport protein B [Bacteroidetes bacterium]|nr:ferrous iron transport protein B [Bacteroidota bacterium]